MALTRKMLKAMGIEEEKIDQIIDAHSETVDGLKKQVDAFKADAEALPGVQKQLSEAQSDLEAFKKDSWKVKYEALKGDYDAYKADQEKKAIHAAKETAYRELLKAAGISEKRIESVLKVSDVDGVELDEKGAIKDSAKLTTSIKDEWADFIVKEHTSGAKVTNPASNNGGGRKTRAEIMAIPDRDERHKAIAENFDLFENAKGEN